MFTPGGKDAGKTDRIMLLATWTKYLNQKKDKPQIIEAGMGKPTFPANEIATQVISDTWQKIHSKSVKAHGKLRRSSEILQQAASVTNVVADVNMAAAKNSKNQFSFYFSVLSLLKKFWQFIKNIFSANKATAAKTVEAMRNEIAQSEVSLDYGHPQGDFVARKKLADGFTRWYSANEYNLPDFDPVKFTPEDIIFTVGEAAAINSVARVIEKANPYGRIVITFPYYSLYSQVFNKNELHPIDTMSEKGYKLTAAALEKSLAEAEAKQKIDGRKINAFVFCNPNNPTGTIIDKEELLKTANVLRNYLKNNPETKIILDEAYAEMQLNGKKPLSLLQVAPDLKQHIILMRSGTKGMSMAGERMAGAAIFDKAFTTKVLENTIKSYGHSPRTLQLGFAEAFLNFDSTEHQQIVDFYKPQVEYVAGRLIAMGAAMPDPAYKPEATFYVMADLSDLLGAKIIEEAKAALGHDKTTITTDEELIYDLLFKDEIMLAPLKYYGLDERKGYIRITCSSGDSQLKELMDRIENRLQQARQQQLLKLNQNIVNIFASLNLLNVSNLEKLKIQFTNLELKYLSGDLERFNAKELKEITKQFCQLLSELTAIHDACLYAKHNTAIVKIQSVFRGYKARKTKRTLKENIEWMKWVKNNVFSEFEQRKFFAYQPDKRAAFKPWVDYLIAVSRPITVSDKQEHDNDKTLKISKSSPSLSSAELKKEQSALKSKETGKMILQIPSEPLKTMRSASFAGVLPKLTADTNADGQPQQVSLVSKSSPNVLCDKDTGKAQNYSQRPPFLTEFWKDNPANFAVCDSEETTQLATGLPISQVVLPIISQ